MHQPAQDAGLREALQVIAGLAQLDALAQHVADQEALAHEGIELDPAREYLTPGLLVAELDPRVARQALERLGLDQRDRVLGPLVEVPIALEPLAGDHAHAVDRLGKHLALGGDRYLLDDAFAHPASLADAAAGRVGAGSGRLIASITDSIGTSGALRTPWRHDHRHHPSHRCQLPGRG